MFNTGGFNHLTFNRSLTVEIFGSFSIDLDLNVSIDAVMELRPTFTLDESLDFDFEAFRERLGQFVLDQSLSLSTNAVRERTGKFQAGGELDVNFEGGRYHIDYVEFTGDFKPGDTIEIDSKTLGLTQNGVNALPNMNGDFIDLALGNNILTYTDSETGRTVRMRITHNDKFV